MQTVAITYQEQLASLITSLEVPVSEYFAASRTKRDVHLRAKRSLRPVYSTISEKTSGRSNTDDGNLGEGHVDDSEQGKINTHCILLQ